MISTSTFIFFMSYCSIPIYVSASVATYCIYVAPSVRHVIFNINKAPIKSSLINYDQALKYNTYYQ